MADALLFKMYLRKENRGSTEREKKMADMIETQICSQCCSRRDTIIYIFKLIAR